MSNTLQRIGALIDLGHEAAFEDLATKIETKPKLSDELQAKLDSFKNTPILEPELFELIEGKDQGALVLHIFTKEEVKAAPAVEIGQFLFALEQKITGYKEEDGSFKTTPNTLECDLPDFLEARELVDLGQEERDARDAILEANVLSKGKAIEAFNATSKKLQDRTYEISGLNIEKLTDWEKTLVASQVYTTALNAGLSSMGRGFLGS